MTPRGGGADFLMRALVTVLLIALAGCRSPEPASAPETGDATVSKANQHLARGSLEAVEIRSQDRETIRETVESVFTSAGLTVAARTLEEVVFERPASRRERAAYGTWHGDEVRVRLRVELVELGFESYLVRSHSFIIRDAGGFSQDEQPLSRARVRDYSHLLNEVATRLN